MSLDVLRSTTREIASQLAHGDYALVIGRCVKSRLTADDLQAVISDYGRKLVSPPADAYGDLDALQVKGAVVPRWSVRAPLWTEEEGRSDLTLEMTITMDANSPRVELDDLHVL